MATPPPLASGAALSAARRAAAAAAAAQQSVIPAQLRIAVHASGLLLTGGLAALLWMRRRRRHHSPVPAAEPVHHATYQPPPGPLVLMCFLSGMLAYAARSAPSMVLPYITEGTPMTHAERAAFLSAFFYGYLPANLAAGVAVKHFGAGRVLCAAVLLWSTCTAALPLCAGSVAGLVGVRVATALAQSPLMPCCYQLLSCTLPSAAAKTRANGFVNAGSQAGVALCFGAVPIALEGSADYSVPAYPWPVVFYAVGALGLLWAAVWAALGLLAADHPASRRPKPQPPPVLPEGRCAAPCEPPVPPAGSTAPAERPPGPPPPPPPPPPRDTTSSPPPNDGRVPWGRLVTTPAFHALVVGHFVQNWGIYIFLAWLPTFFREALHIEAGHAGLAAVPYCGTTLGCLTAGLVGDGLLRAWGSSHLQRVRRVMTAAGFLLPAALLTKLAGTTDQMQAVALVTLALSSLTMLSAGVMAGHYDLAHDLAGVLASVTNSIATLPGIFGIMLCQVIVDLTHSWSSVFYLTSVLYVAATLVYFAFGSTAKQFE